MMNAVSPLQERMRNATLLMGVVNVTPDSFYDGGAYLELDKAESRALQLMEDGADIIDVGGESTRPGSEEVNPETEQARILPLIERLCARGIPVSVDTRHASAARHALALGASMVNDISALRGDPDMAQVVAEAGCACVLMHMQGTPGTMQHAPQYHDIIGDVCAFFEERIEFATRQGIAESALWLDPGFGFGKTPAHNLELLRRLREFTRFGLPILVGTSNKSTIGHVLNLPVDQRMEGTAATVAIAIANGAAAVRVHDVKTMARVARMCDAILGRGNDG